MTIEQFAERFRQLLLEAERAGLTVEDIGEMAELVIQADWDMPYGEGQ